MSENRIMSLSFEWEDLPDPRDPRAPQGARCTVNVTERSLRHICEKHICSRGEPWKDFLDSKLLQQLRIVGTTGTDPQQLRAALSSLSDVLGQAARECLLRPLALLYVITIPPKRRATQIWLLVLRSGAQLIVRLHDHAPRAITCFFPHAACSTRKPQQRWRKVVASLVAKFSLLHPDRIQPPAKEDVRNISALQRATQIQFVTLASWGFDTHLEGTPWRGRLDPWA